MIYDALQVSYLHPADHASGGVEAGMITSGVFGCFIIRTGEAFAAANTRCRLYDYKPVVSFDILNLLVL